MGGLYLAEVAEAGSAAANTAGFAVVLTNFFAAVEATAAELW